MPMAECKVYRQKIMSHYPLLKLIQHTRCCFGELDRPDQAKPWVVRQGRTTQNASSVDTMI